MTTGAVNSASYPTLAYAWDKIVAWSSDAQAFGALSPEDQRTYQMLFGIKVLCAFVIFFLASALAGKAQAFATLRKNARTTLTLLLLLAVLVLICATLMRFLPLHPTVQPLIMP